jgi:hypothetical protein
MLMNLFLADDFFAPMMSASDTGKWLCPATCILSMNRYEVGYMHGDEVVVLFV